MSLVFTAYKSDSSTSTLTIKDTDSFGVRLSSGRQVWADPLPFCGDILFMDEIATDETLTISGKVVVDSTYTKAVWLAAFRGIHPKLIDCNEWSLNDSTNTYDFGTGTSNTVEKLIVDDIDWDDSDGVGGTYISFSIKCRIGRY